MQLESMKQAVNHSATNLRFPPISAMPATRRLTETGPYRSFAVVLCFCVAQTKTDMPVKVIWSLSIDRVADEAVILGQRQYRICDPA